MVLRPSHLRIRSPEIGPSELISVADGTDFGEHLRHARGYHLGALGPQAAARPVGLDARVNYSNPPHN